MKYLLLLSLVSVMNSSYGQFSLENTSSRQYSVGLFSTNYFAGLLSGVQGSYWNNNHVFQVGIGHDFTRIHSSSLRSGVDLGYSYYPNGYLNRFNLLFDLHSDLVLNYYKYNTTNNPVYLRYSFIGGFGFSWNISQRFYIKPTLGMGVSINTSTNRAFILGNSSLSIAYRFGSRKTEKDPTSR